LDSLTQIVLGAAVGEAVLGKKVGNKAMLWGAVAGTIPDLDILSRYFMDEVSALEVHRGFTHSIIFSLLFAPIFAFFIKKHERLFLATFFIFLMSVFFFGAESLTGKIISISVLSGLFFCAYKLRPNHNNISTFDWTKLMFWSLITHPLLDAHTTWGTQFFWPHDHRLAYKNIFVADPLYTLPFLIFLIMAFLNNKDNPLRSYYNRLGLIVSSTYMLFTIGFKWIGYHQFTDSLEDQQISYNEVRTRPTPFNSILWCANVETDSSFYIGIYSLLDKDNNIEFIRYEKNHTALGTLASEDKIKRMIKISKGWYIIRKNENGKLLFCDLRFGQAGLGQDKPFVFSYVIDHDDNGTLFLEEAPKTFKGGFSMMKELASRVAGNKN
jgi:inner membrane protein